MATTCTKDDVVRGFQAMLPASPAWYADVVWHLALLLRDGEPSAPAGWLAAYPPAPDATLHAFAALCTQYAQQTGSGWWHALRRTGDPHKRAGWSAEAHLLLAGAGLYPAQVRAPPGTCVQRELRGSPLPQPSMIVLRTPRARTLIVTLDGVDKRL